MEFMLFIFAWLTEKQDSESFEHQVPLIFLGNYLKRKGWNQVFHLLFLDGFERLSGSFVAKLRAVGFEVINFSSEYQRLMRAFWKLERFGNYEMLCFLRWPALLHYLKANKIREQVFHFDGDVIFNASPKEIADDVAGLTFVLQGCPAFVSISNYDWLESYCGELSKFNDDIDGYSSKAWTERSGWEQSYTERWGGIWDRRILASDQDFINYLVHAGKIVQDNPQTFVKHLELYYTENPLYFNSHATIQLSRNRGLAFSSDGDTCYVEGRKIAFWHFQSDFSRYVNAAIVLHNIHYPFRFPNHLNGGISRKLSLGARRVYPMTRSEIYGSLKELNSDKSDSSLSFADIFNCRSYWEKGVFANLSDSCEVTPCQIGN